jgi:poly(ADP-ribose) glycohydrolase ARH3
MSGGRAHLGDKFRGTMLGVAIGDALGAPFEGAPTVAPAALRTHLEDPGRLRYTDDTHMTIGLAESLLACDGFDGAHVAWTFALNYAAETWRGYGAGPPRVFRLLEAGVPWDAAARMLFDGHGSYGNGGAMRVAPVALLAYDDLERVAALARRSAAITHAHELGIEGAVLQACAIALLLRRTTGPALEVPRFLETLYGLVGSPRYGQKLDTIRALLPAADQAAVVNGLGHGVAAVEAVPAALYAFLRHPDDFAAAVTFAIGLGGDTDTIAAMTGALSGAYLGEPAIPARWRQGVEGADRLRELADALLDLAAFDGHPNAHATRPRTRSSSGAGTGEDTFGPGDRT